MGKVTFKNGFSFELPDGDHPDAGRGSSPFVPHPCQKYEFEVKEMTDLEKFLELYRSVGVEPEIEDRGGNTWLKLEADDHEKVVGYHGFYTTLYFDQNGKFLSQGIWE